MLPSRFRTAMMAARGLMLPRYVAPLRRGLSSGPASRMSAALPDERKAGLGVGHIRTGVEAIHRVKTRTPSFLSRPKTCQVIGAPMTFGQPLVGTDHGPNALREAGLHQALMKLSWRVDETGDLDFGGHAVDDEYEGPGLCYNPRLVGEGNRKLAAAVQSAVADGKFPLVLGGDHSIGIGVLAGLMQERPDTGVIWVDAHADINTPETSPSGNMHGMPLGLMLDLFDSSTVPGCEWLKDVPKLSPQQLVYVGLRDIDQGERNTLSRLGIHCYTMSHVDRYGIGRVMDMAIESLGSRPLHLSYDIDACDPGIAPGTGTSVRGGLTYREAHFVAEAVAETGRLGSMDIVEVNPKINPDSYGNQEDEATVGLGLALVGSALGNRII